MLNYRYKDHFHFWDNLEKLFMYYNAFSLARWLPSGAIIAS